MILMFRCRSDEKYATHNDANARINFYVSHVEMSITWKNVNYLQA